MAPNNYEFVEIREDHKDDRPPTRQAYAVQIEPKECSQLVQKLSTELPLPKELSHLKRVHRLQAGHVNRSKEEEESDELPAKKPKVVAILQVLIGPATSPDLETRYGPLYPVVVPSYHAQSHAESKDFNTIWPTTYLPLNSEEHQEKLRKLCPAEVQQMKQTMKLALETRSVMVVDPVKKQVVASSDQERTTQPAVDRNPLATPILLALQGVSRLERASKSEDMKGQYLCTGYDLYTYEEPTVFEAMACVHARLRRLIFAEQEVTDAAADANKGQTKAWLGGCTKHKVHCLPGTNHHYRAFAYRASDA